MPAVSQRKNRNIRAHSSTHKPKTCHLPNPLAPPSPSSRQQKFCYKVKYCADCKLCTKTVKNCRGSLDEQEEQGEGNEEREREIEGKVEGKVEGMRFILESQPSAHLLHCTVHAPDYKQRPLAVCTSIYKIHLRC